MTCGTAFGLHSILEPGAAAVLALGAHSAGGAGSGAACAAQRARESIGAMTAADWHLADNWARRERAEGVLGRALTSIAVEGVSMPDAWLRMGMVADFRQLRLRESLMEALEVLSAARVPRMLLKGAALATSYYAGGFPERPMEDVDVLVPPEAADEAHRLLLRAGWMIDAGTGGVASRPGHHHLPALRHRGSGHILELHRSMLTANNPFAWSDGAVWQGAAEVQFAEVGGVTALVPRAEDLLLHGAVHLSWAHELRIGVWGWVRDLVALAPAVDWSLVVKLARERRVASCVYWPLRLGVELGGAAVASDACEALRPVSRGRARILSRHYVQAAVPPRLTPGGVRLSRLAWGFGLAPRGSGVGGARPWSESAVAGGSLAAGVGDSPVGEDSPGDRGERGEAGATAESGDVGQLSGWRGAIVREVRSLPVWLRWAGRLIRG